ncbi:MAG: hypothetical protein HY806_08180, partial [Nitrospirae bacterium]|nr:hypothetical protein [Nitrospirota bacterium]
MTALPVQKYQTSRNVFNINIVSPVEILAKSLSSGSGQVQKSREAPDNKHKADNPVMTPQFSITQTAPPKTMDGSNNLDRSKSSNGSNGLNSSKGLNELNDLNNSASQKAAPLNPKAFLFDRETIEKFAKEAPQ